MCIFVSARLQATAAPDAPAPMISTSTGSFMVSPSRRNIPPIDSGASACITTGMGSEAIGGRTSEMETYDYIVVGAGSARAAAAHRLCATAGDKGRQQVA